MSPFKNTELKSDWRSDFITEHLSHYINSVRVEYDEWDGYEFHHERGDV